MERKKYSHIFWLLVKCVATRLNNTSLLERSFMIEFFIKTLFVYFVSQLAAETKLTSARFAELT